MKPQKITLISVAILLFISCRTSRQIPTPTPPLTPAPTTPLPVQNVPYAQVPSEPTLTPLQQRIDSLLRTADTLLSTSQLGLHIINLTTRETIYQHAGRQRMRPASAEKVVTAIAALDILGPSYQLCTQLLTTAPVSNGILQGDIYIKGVMDPLLNIADLQHLASQLKAAGIHKITGHLIADTSFKDNDQYGWGWCWDDENPTLTPLLCNGKPTLTAQLTAALKKQGITIGKAAINGTAPLAARQIAAVSRPITDVLQPMLKESNNLCAEAVFYQLSRNTPPTTKHYSRKKAAQNIQNVINRAILSVPAGNPSSLLPALSTSLPSSTVADGSGLSLYNYQTPETFTTLLTYALQHTDSIFNPLLAALPIAGNDGTLKNRMIATPAANNVRAKTGTVTAVSTLVGYTTQRSTSHLIAFAIMNQGIAQSSAARTLQDKICILLSE